MPWRVTDTTMDVLRTAHRESAAARRVLTQAIRRHGRPASTAIAIRQGASITMAWNRALFSHTPRHPRPGVWLVLYGSAHPPGL